VFNLLCGDRDEMLMSKIEHYFGSKVAEVICTPSFFLFMLLHYVLASVVQNNFCALFLQVKSWDSDEDFKNALKAAGLLW
jgi:hypothetical protein